MTSDLEYSRRKRGGIPGRKARRDAMLGCPAVPAEESQSRSPKSTVSCSYLKWPRACRSTRPVSALTLWGQRLCCCYSAGVVYSREWKDYPWFHVETSLQHHLAVTGPASPVSRPRSATWDSHKLPWHY